MEEWNGVDSRAFLADLISGNRFISLFRHKTVFDFITRQTGSTFSSS